MITGNDILALRQRLKLSRKKIADATGLTEGKIWSIERGRVITAVEQEALTQWWSTFDAETLLPSTTLPAPSTDQPAPIEIPQIDIRELSATQGDTPAEPLSIPTAGGGPLPQEGVRLTSNSELQTLKDCPRKWWLAWYRGLKLRGGESPLGARAIGDRIHRALKMWYVPEGFTPMDPTVALERLIIDDWSAICARGNPSIELVTKFNSQSNLERAIIQGYVQWLEQTGEDAEFEVIAAETYIEAPLVEGFYAEPYHTVKLIGKLDVRVRRRQDGVIMFIDHKTVGDLIQPVKTLALDEQMLRYHLLEWLNTPDGEKHCDAALYNMLRRVKRSAQSKPPYYKRVVVHHNIHELESIQTRTRGEIIHMLDIEQKLREGANPLTVVYPRPSRDCTWKCQFFPVCGMFDDGSRAEDMVKNFYVEGDPLSYYASDTVEVSE